MNDITNTSAPEAEPVFWIDYAEEQGMTTEQMLDFAESLGLARDEAALLIAIERGEVDSGVTIVEE